MKQSSTRYKSTQDFGKALGLSEIEIQLGRQKTKLIEKLRTERTTQGLSQAALAKRVNSQQPAIARMESGLISQVSMDFLLKVALALGVSVTISSKKAA